MGRFGLSAPATPNLGAAATMVQSVLDGSSPMVKVSYEDLMTPGVQESLAQLEPLLPAYGLTTVAAPDGGGIIFDPTKYDPKTGQTIKPQAVGAAPAPTTPPAPPSAGDPATVVGTSDVNAERAKAIQPPPPSSTQSGLLGRMTTRAY
jgi:hypothetical protein